MNRFGLHDPAQNDLFGTISQPQSLVVPRDYATIQEAINRVAQGGTIFVEAGTYQEELLITKSLILQADPTRGIVSLVAEHPDKPLITILA